MIDFSINNVEKLTPRWEINLTLIYMIYTYLSKWNQNNLEVNTEVQKKNHSKLYQLSETTAHILKYFL